MKISWLGRASFLIETGSTSIINDPIDERSGLPPYQGKVDLALVSHEHWDHNAVEVLKGNPRIIRQQVGFFDLGEVKVTGISSFHDKDGGKKRGPNVIYKIEAEGISVVHLGDLGTLLDADQIAAIGQVDVLFIPVGGVYTIDAREAVQVVNQLKPATVIPMHFRMDDIATELSPVEDFTKNFDKVVKKPYLQVNQAGKNQETQVIVLDLYSS